MKRRTTGRLHNRPVVSAFTRRTATEAIFALDIRLVLGQAIPEEL
jgi:hypothetical protein